jgi:hypothetical protein
MAAAGSTMVISEHGLIAGVATPDLEVIGVDGTFDPIRGRMRSGHWVRAVDEGDRFRRREDGGFRRIDSADLEFAAAFEGGRVSRRCPRREFVLFEARPEPTKG